MPPSSPLEPTPIARAHPLAAALIERLRARPRARVLDYCTGSGRNAAALSAAGFDVSTVADDDADPGGALAKLGPFAAIVSTHGLLHGTEDDIVNRIAALSASLEEGGALYATFGSVRDARFGRGRRIGPATFAPIDGDERGVAHTYFTREQIERLLLEFHLDIERLEESSADAVAGSWAHRTRPLSGAVHWFAIARRASTTSSSGLDALA
jgi:protein-L-isoaspartate O-methyltransferase